MGGKKGKKKSKKKKTYTKAQKMAKARIAAKKTTTTKTTGGKTSGIGPVASGKAYAKAVNTAKNQPKKKTSGIGPVASGSDYAKSLSTAKNQPTKKASGIGPYASGAKYAAALKASPPVAKAKFTAAPKLVAEATKKVNPFNLPGLIKEGDAAREGVRPQVEKPGFLDKILNRNSETQRMINELSAAPGGDKLAAASTDSSMSGLGIKTAPSYFRVKSPDTFGAPSQEAVDKAAGIKAGGINIGGSGFTPKNLNDPTARAADTYDASLNPNSFKGLSDGETFGVGPVASGDAYARGLNIDNNNVENKMRSFVKNRLPFIDAIPGVNTRPLTDKEIADKRVKAQQMRKEMMMGRGGGGGGARLPVAPLTPEEILLPEETAQAVPDYQQAQTGVDPNRLMQIQQEAYLQAFNPSYNPMFRFFNRRGLGRGAFRKAFRRRD